MAVGLATAMSASASVTISGSDFNNPALVGSFNGTYVAGSPGYMHLAYTGPNDNAVVGAKGPFGALGALNMSFNFSNLIGDNGNGPYAAFGVSVNGLWDNSAQEFLIIAKSGNQINGATLIHVLNVNNNTDYISVSSSVSLASILGTTYNGVEFGDMQVLRAYADFGAATGSGTVSGSVDINSITVSAVPEPTTMIAGALLLLPFGASTIRLLRKTRTA